MTTDAPDAGRKPDRGPFTTAEEDRVEQMYRSGEYSSRDIAREMNSNPSKILKILRARDVPLNPPGPSALQKRNRQRSSAQRKEERKRQAEVRLAQEIAEARKRDRVDRASVRLEDVTAAGGAMMLEEARVMLEEARVAIEERVNETLEEPRAEIHWQGESLHQAQDAGERIHAVGELLDGVGFFSGQLPHGHLVWQPTVEGPLPEGVTLADLPAGALPQGYFDEDEQTNLEDLQAEHRAELDRAHTWGKDQWAGGVRHGYDRATSDIADFLRTCIKETTGIGANAALTEFLEMLEDGEHFYRTHKDRKPWMREENWR